MEYASILQKLAASLESTYKNTVFEHSGDVGDSREKGVIGYLDKVMPRQYGFQSGEVFDTEGNNSGQVDIIIYDDLFSTIFTDGTDKVLAPVESTYGIISVKSKMGIAGLEHAIEGIKHYDALKRPKAKPGAIYIMPDCVLEGGSNIVLSGTKQQNINCIFAFDTTVAYETIKNKIREARCIDLLVVPGKICAIGRLRAEYSFSKNNEPMSNFIIRSEQSIGIFIILLQLYLSHNRLMGGDIRNHLLKLVNQCEIII